MEIVSYLKLAATRFESQQVQIPTKVVKNQSIAERNQSNQRFSVG